MSYYQDFCRNTFTAGQIERMEVGWEAFRLQGGGKCACAIEPAETGSSKSGKSKSKTGKTGKTSKSSRRGERGIRRLQKRGKFGFSFATTTHTQRNTEEPPPCMGVTDFDFVSWFEIDGIDNEITVDVDSPGLFAAIAVYKGSCSSLSCVDGIDSFEVSPLSDNGSTQLTFDSDDDESYYIVVTTKNQPGEVTVTLSNDITGKSGGKSSDSGKGFGLPPAPGPSPGFPPEIPSCFPFCT